MKKHDHAKQHMSIRDERGFTIVEVLISLLIFSIAIAGVITVAAQGGLNVDDSKLSLTATYLADEGVELMRAMRDTSVIGGSTEAAGWTAFTSIVGSTVCTTAVGGTPASPCDIDPTVTPPGPFPSPSANIVTCTVGGFCPLYYLSTGNYTDISPGVGSSPSPYSRQITVAQIGTSGNEVQVVVKVKYAEGVSTKSVTETENLFNWY